MSCDELFSAGLLWLFKAFLFTLSSVLFALAIWALPATVFPNDAGWHDLSSMEILFLTAFTLLTVRYVIKVKKHSDKVGRAIYRYLTAIGIHTFVFLGSEVLLGAQSLYNHQLLISHNQEYWSLAYDASLLLLIFAIAPKGAFKLWQATSANFPSRTVTAKDEKQDNV
jgi:hypothetical protein